MRSTSAAGSSAGIRAARCSPTRSRRCSAPSCSTAAGAPSGPSCGGLWLPLMDELEPESLPLEEPKSTLQEMAQQRGLPLPVYRQVATRGPAHALVYVFEVEFDGRPAGRGEGSSKRAAQQDGRTRRAAGDGRGGAHCRSGGVSGESRRRRLEGRGGACLRPSWLRWRASEATKCGSRQAAPLPGRHRGSGGMRCRYGVLLLRRASRLASAQREATACGGTSEGMRRRPSSCTRRSSSGRVA